MVLANSEICRLSYADNCCEMSLRQRLLLALY
jgi:hypothetical protein